MPMIALARTNKWTLGSGTPVPPKNTTASPSTAKPRSYTLGVEVSGQHHLNFRYLAVPGDKPPTPDAPLDMRVVDDENVIELSLDTTNVDWYFDRTAKDVLVVGQADGKPALPKPLEAYYYDLEFVGTGKCTTIRFCAKLSKELDANGNRYVNTNPMTIQVVLEQDGIGMGAPAPLILYIDPGIKNPGDAPG